MTTKIRIIPETLSNKIAAGEVVQRPASVVKELLENSIDAGADEITVEVIRAGKGLIKVTDNGSGMSRDDALLSIERFATSKLKNEDDLFNIKTLGFRGEALPSIASVSKFTIITKTENEMEGVRLYIEGGKLKDVKGIGAPTGTVIEVGNLFFNTPARQKFLKSNSAELFHITDMVVKIAASRHNLHLKLISDGKVVVDFTKSADIYNRVCDIFESDVYKHLIKIDERGGNMRIFGFVSNPVYATNSTKKFFTYINGRYIFDKLVNYAIFSAYKSKIEERKYPAVALFIEMPFSAVDVNVHPTKKDVRFADQGYVIGLIESAIKNALSGAHLLDSEIFEEPKEAFRADSIKDSMKEYLRTAIPQMNAGDESNYTQKKEYETDLGDRNYIPPYISEKSYAVETKNDQDEMHGDYIRILGQLGASFVICTKGDALLLIDQHAAHERILYDALVQKFNDRKVIQQPLLIPIIFEVSKTDSLLIMSYSNEFREIGFTIEPFGKNSYAVKDVPDLLLGYDYKSIIHDIISELILLEKSGDIQDKITGLLKLLACKGAIKANRRLTKEEITRLLIDMTKADFPTNCPHGRPVIVELTQKDIRKMFKRL